MPASILVARAVFPEVIARLRRHFEVEANPSDTIYTPQQLIERLQGKAGAFTTGSERIDAAVLAACPQLRVVANMRSGMQGSGPPAYHCDQKCLSWAWQYECHHNRYNSR